MRSQIDQHSKNYKLLILQNLPDISKFSEFAHAYHESGECQNLKTPHFHLIVPKKQLPNFPGSKISCLSECYEQYINQCSGRVVKGLRLSKLRQPRALAKVAIAEKKNPTESETSSVPVLPISTYNRVTQLWLSEVRGDFCAIVDILLDGYGSIETESMKFIYNKF